MNLAVHHTKLYADYRNHNEDPRIAYGAVPLQPNWPKSPCFHCWPALITATGYDPEGRPCCPLCASNPHRRMS